ncbi:ATP-binding protein [Candidatus Micrarchaeota archaeon]|nr:ATP-binding protein [Candidatus Micrarchaeota archaeon]
MASIEYLKRVIVSQREAMEELMERERIIKRDIDVKRLKSYIKHPNILAILGIRRCGKSVFTWLLLTDKKFGYINFFDERLTGLKVDEMDKVVQAFYELYGDIEYFVFDEIQTINGWERFVSRLRTSKKVIITGSNSQLLSSELATYLTGRHTNFELFPFNFNEFLLLQKITLDKDWVYSTKKVAKVKNLLKNFIFQGGFPEVDKFGKIFLQTIYKDIIDKDILMRYKVKNLQALKTIARYLISNSSGEFTFTKLKKITNLKDVHTVGNYVEYLKNSYLIIIVERFSFKLKEQIIAPKKVYCVDTGLLNTVSFKFSENFGKLMENLVIIELLRRKSYNSLEWEIYYWKDHQQREVDFVLKKGKKVKQLIQVTNVSSKEGLNDREISSLLKAGKELKCNNLLVITWDYEDKEKIENKTIKFIPLWKWLLKI